MFIKPKILIFASGTKTGGGSGFQNLVEASRDGRLHAEVIAVVSNHTGGVFERATELGIEFIYMTNFSSESYQKIVTSHTPDLVVLSGWLKKVQGLDQKTTINIHPGPLPRFGGLGMYGSYVHQEVFEAHKNGEISHTGLVIHNVNEEYDSGSVIFQCDIPLFPTDTPYSIEERVKRFEHVIYPEIIGEIINQAL